MSRAIRVQNQIKALTFWVLDSPKAWLLNLKKRRKRRSLILTEAKDEDESGMRNDVAMKLI